MLFAFIAGSPEPANCGLKTVVMWICESVNLTANENIHHEEERTSFFCCSAQFRWSMHQPGYVQGGQKVGRDYLLLRIHVRGIRSDIHTLFWKINFGDLTPYLTYDI